MTNNLDINMLSLGQNVATMLGDTWEIQKPKWSTEAIPDRVFLIRDKGEATELHLFMLPAQGFADRGKIGIMSSPSDLPLYEHTDSPNYDMRSSYSEVPKTSILVSPTRTAEAIAKEITRRLLPGAEVHHTEVKANMARRLMGKAVQAETVAAMRKAGVSIHEPQSGGTPWGHLGYQADAMRFDVRDNGSIVLDDRHHHLPLNLALALNKLLRMDDAQVSEFLDGEPARYQGQ